MKNLRLLYIFIILIIIPSYLFSATIYMRNGETHKGEIVGETEEKFFMKLQNENYSIFYTHDEFKKSDIFCILNDENYIQYPRNLNIPMPGQIEELHRRIEELENKPENYFLERQVELEAKRTKAIHDIRTILFVQSGIAFIGAFIIAFAQ